MNTRLIIPRPNLTLTSRAADAPSEIKIRPAAGRGETREPGDIRERTRKNIFNGFDQKSNFVMTVSAMNLSLDVAKT